MLQVEQEEKWGKMEEEEVNRRNGAGGRGGAGGGIGEDGGAGLGARGEGGGAGRLESSFLVQLKQEVVFPPGRKLLLVGRPVGILLFNMADT